MKVWSDDTKQAYSQCDEMNRYIALIPPKELNFPKGILLRILKYLYGLSESGDAWNQKLKEALSGVLKMIPMTGDTALYRHDMREPYGTSECDGIIGTYVDGLFCCSTDELKQRTARLRRVIKLKKSKQSPFVFAGVRVRQEPGFNVTLDQQE